MEKVLAEIQKMGFSQYEAKAYLTLLQHSPVTGYELSKRSGVPRSMIYEVIHKLAERGALYTIPSEPLKYMPVEAKEFLQRVRRNMDMTFSYLEQSLPFLAQGESVQVISRIQGYESVTEELRSQIRRAKEELWLSLWEPQIENFVADVVDAEQRQVKVLSVLFGGKGLQLGTTFHHDYMPPEVVQNRIGGKLSLVVRDREEVVIANFQMSQASWAVKTQDRALVLIATEFIRHDSMIEAMSRHFGPDKVDELWRNHPDLRYVVEGGISRGRGNA